MFELLKHLWAKAPRDIAAICPLPAEGQLADAEGFVNHAQLIHAWDLTALVAALLAVTMVVLCYNATQQTTGRRFSRRWAAMGALTGVLSAVAAFMILKVYPFTIELGSCDTTTDPLQRTYLGLGYIIPEVTVRFVWGLLAFVLLSILLTKTIGRLPWARGFFNNRGVPLPRFLPVSKVK